VCDVVWGCVLLLSVDERGSNVVLLERIILIAAVCASVRESCSIRERTRREWGVKSPTTARRGFRWRRPEEVESRKLSRGVEEESWNESVSVSVC